MDIVIDEDDTWCPHCGTEIKYGRSYCNECDVTFIRTTGR